MFRFERSAEDVRSFAMAKCGWCKRQAAMLARWVTLDAAQFALWRRQQEVRLLAKYRAVKAELLNWFKRLG